MLGDIKVFVVETPAQAAEASVLLDEVWHATSMVAPEVIVAALHSGGYCAIARLGATGDGEVVGASFALATNTGILHSHVTGVAQNRVGIGIGTQLKRHQWYWAQLNGYHAISWTFDPLVRRNAWFNLVKLGASVVSYHKDFYGELADAINVGEHSDRLLVHWSVPTTGDPQMGTFVTGNIGDVVVPTPDDIETLRRQDRSAAQHWRSRQRESFALLAKPGAKIRGLDNDYSYVISIASEKI